LPTTGVTSNSSGAGVALNGLRSALALPEPAIDFLQTFFGPASSAVSLFLHCGSFLVLILSVFGNLISMALAVVLLAGSFLTESLNFSDFGFFLVPALAGETLAVASMLGAGVWA
jgi:hypothetical protein